VRGKERDDDDLAKFGCPELPFAWLEILRQHVGRGCRQLARLGAVEQHKLDGALLVLEAIRRLDHRRRRNRRAGDGSEQLLTQHGAPLLGDKSLLVKACVAKDIQETLVVELAARPLEARMLRDTQRDLRMGDAEAKLPHALVEQHLADDLIFDLLVDAQRASLFERDRAPDLTTKILQPLGIELAELLNGDLGPPDLGKR